ncbi:MAG: DedA family protein [Paludibacteraceae bacterium]|nr:DedA family protein [Paludibacteraceae bacterium]
MESLVEFCLENLNYWTVSFFMMIESSFIPFPSEVVVPPAAYKAAAGELNVFLVVLAATLGATVGAIINYGLAYFLGRPFIYYIVNSRFGRMCLLSQDKVEVAERYFEEHGALSTMVGRLMPAVRQLISIPAGLFKMNFFMFLLYTAIGAGLWNSVLAAIGYYLHSFIPQEELLVKVKEYSHVISLIFFLLGGAVIAYVIYKTKKKN